MIDQVHLSLEKAQQSISILRDSILASAESRAAVSEKSAVPKHPQEKHFSVTTRKLLAEFICLKTKHDFLIKHVDEARKESQKEQNSLLNAQSRLDNLLYEKKMLKDEIELCQKSPHNITTELKIKAPEPELNSKQDDTQAHKHTMQLLTEELRRRKSARAEVDVVMESLKKCRKELGDTKSELRDLPNLLRTLSNDLRPLRALGESTSVPSFSPTISNFRQLPAPLYVLAREAIGHIESYGNVSISIVGGSADESLQKNIYASHPSRVQIKVQSERIPQCLRVEFRYHTKLKIVGVTSVILSGGDETQAYPTKELQMLYPYDYGEESPNPSNVHLEKEGFKFDAKAACESRPFVWANILCGIPSLLPLSPHHEQVSQASQFRDWPSEAMGTSTHLRFKDVCSTLRNRLESIVSLKNQIDLLMRKQLPVSPTEIGLLAEPKTKLDDFVKMQPQEWAGDERLVRKETGGKCTEVWCMTISRESLRIKCMIGIEPDYPLGPPVFRLICDHGNRTISEKDVFDLERCVNKISASETLKGREDLLIGAQIANLLTHVDRLYDASTKQAEGAV